jgi:hypothetical protein
MGARDLRKKKKNVTDREPPGKGQKKKKKNRAMGSPPEKGGKGPVLPAD